MWEKFKISLDSETGYLAVLLILIAVASFGLGRQSVFPRVPGVGDVGERVRVIPAQPLSSSAAPVTVTPAPVDEVADVVIASRSGSRYHLPECPGAKQITAANRITFPSIAAAQAAGYTPAANCPGLQ